MRAHKARLAGFTLIEIIVVLIILGMLAAVAVPRYYGLTEEARQGKLQQAANEAVADFHLAFTKYTVDYYRPPEEIDDLATADLLGADLSNVNLGDFTAAFTGGTGDPVADVTVTVTDLAGETYSTTFPWP